MLIMNKIILSNIEQKGEVVDLIPMYDTPFFANSFENLVSYVSVTIRNYIGRDENGSVINFYLKGKKLTDGCNVVLKYKRGLFSSLLEHGHINIKGKEYSIMSIDVLPDNSQIISTELPAV